MNPRRAKRRLSSFALFVALTAEIYILMNDLPILKRNDPSVSPRVPPVAELISRHNQVKVQNDGELIWEETKNGQTLYRRQSILTLESSKAEVAFLDGTGLQIDEKSLVLLEKTPSDDSMGYQRIIVKLLRGTIHKNAPRKTSDLLRRMGPKTPEIEIQTGDAHILLSPSSELTIIASPENTHGARVLVQSGEVEVNTPQGALTVKSGEETTLSKPGSITPPVARKLPFTPLSPKGGQSLEALSKSQPVRFRWNASRESAGNPQEIELTQDPEFKQDVIRFRVAATEPPLEYVEINLNVPAELKPTLWRWRVRTAGQSGESVVGPVETFWIRPQPVPALLSPVDQAVIPPGRELDFRWSSLEGATRYEFEMKDAAATVTTEAFTHVANLKAGTTSWRVRAKFRDGGASPWSGSRELIVRDPIAPPSPAALIPEAPPPPPSELDEPEITPAPKHTQRNFLRQALDFIFPEAWAAESRTEQSWTVRLKWHEVPGVKRYRVQISKNGNFEKIMSEGEADAPHWNWEYKVGMENSKGRAFFRVASISASGQTGAFSKPKPINIPASILGSPPKILAMKEAKPVSLVKSPVVPTPKPVSAPAPSVSQNTLPPPPPGGTAWKWNAAVNTGYGSQSQSSSDLAITAVRPQAPYLQQKISIAAELNRVRGNESSRWIGEFVAGLGAFHAPDDPRQPVQSDFRAFTFRLTALRQAKAAQESSGPWQIYYGVSLDRSFRWVKNGPQSVDSQAALSLGPSARVVRTYNQSQRLLSIRETGLALNLPLSGVLTSGQAGLQGWIWGEWNLAALNTLTSIGLRIEAETAYLRWAAPTGTATFAWTFWVAPAFHF